MKKIFKTITTSIIFLFLVSCVSNQQVLTGAKIGMSKGELRDIYLLSYLSDDPFLDGCVREYESADKVEVLAAASKLTYFLFDQVSQPSRGCSASGNGRLAFWGSYSRVMSFYESNYKKKKTVKNSKKKRDKTSKWKPSGISDEDLDKEINRIFAESRRKKEEESNRKKITEENRQKERAALEKKKQQELTLLIQKMLISLGYSLQADGKAGLQTTSAVKAYQTEESMYPVDGKISESLLISLQKTMRENPNIISFDNYEPIGSGSGFLVDSNGNILTNDHVISGCDLISTGDNKIATLVKSDKTNDIAVINSKTLKDFSAVLFSRDDPTLGQRVLVSGYPFNSILENLNFTSGTVSSELGISQNVNQFQLTAPIQPGNSGGPIFNEYGGILGMTVATISTQKFEEYVESLAQNINFGIKKSTLVKFLDQLDIEYRSGNANFFAGDANVAEVAKESTILVKCWKIRN